MCNHCPYVKHVAAGLAQLARDYQAKGVAVVGINSNDVAEHPADSPEQMVHEAELRGYTFPYLYDETQEVAKAYQAACTPDFLRLRQGPEAGLSRAVGRQPARLGQCRSRARTCGRRSTPCWPARRGPQDQKPSIGCNIKWKPGNEPEYFK